MTRFARAKGSKASNEKTPEDGTPWEVMKNQLLETKKQNEDAKKREEVEQQRIDNYQNFLKEQKVQKRKATWCDFPEVNQGQKKTKPDKKSKPGSPYKGQPNTLEVNQETNETNSSTTETKKKKKNKNKNKKTTENIAVDGLTNSTSAERKPLEDQDPKMNEKKKKKNVKKSNSVQESHVANNNGNANTTTQQNENPSHQNNQNKKKKKFDGNQPSRRKPINDNSFQLIINGKEVDLVRFEGFPIMKKDAERLTELKSNMMKKGIPKSEVQRTIKLERRRAEKALARVKRDVCYNCRKGGHNLSDCPELKSKIPGVEAGDGMCFKCGSTEHRQFECKVQKDKEFRFATCFICKDQGHIARQCPDNPKGLYPNGGGCKLCGDVTHLRKDCPTIKEQKEETSIKLSTLQDDEIEGIAPQHKAASTTEEKAKKPKKIKF